MKTLVSARERCHACGEKHNLTKAEAELLANLPGSRLVAYFCPANNGWHVEDESNVREYDQR